MKRGKIFVFGLLVLASALYYWLELGRFFNLEYFKATQHLYREISQAHPLATMAAYFFIYVLVAATSVPGALLLTLAGGALFDLATGVVLVSFASSIGATLGFVSSRYIYRDWVTKHFADKLRIIDAGIEKDGAQYLFMLRLIPLFPFFVINSLMGVTKIRTVTFYWVSQIGMLAATIVYVNAGTQISRIEHPGDILSLPVLFALTLAGVFPLLIKKAIAAFRHRQLYAKWRKPKQFDRNLIVIGAGSAGLVTSYIASAVKAKVTLIESHKMGGDCLNTGCVPSKSLIRAANLLKQAGPSADADFPRAMARVHEVVRTIEPHDSIERYTALGVEVVQGHARLVSPWEVEVNGQILSTRSIVIATGARPFVPSIPGLTGEGFHTSETIWDLNALPRRMVVLGGGPIGCELAQMFARFGAHVTIVEMGERLLSREDPEVAQLVAESMAVDGVDILTNHHTLRCERNNGEKTLIVAHDGIERAIDFDVILCAVGRVARTENMGLEALGISLTPQKTIATDHHLQTIYPNIFACGDAAGPFQFTHTASHQAWYAAVNALFGSVKRFSVDYSVIPWATFTDPEVARVGLSETEAVKQGIAYEVTRFDFQELDRAIIDGAPQGFIKVLTVPGKDKILGVTIVGHRAGDVIAEYVLAMKHGLGLNKVLQTIHIYPTLAEVNKSVAGQWRRAHAPHALLRWASRYHAWRRR